MSDLILELNNAVEKLPFLPGSATTGQSADKDRVALEQKIAGLTRTAIISAAASSAITDEKFSNLIIKLLNQPTAGEPVTGKKEDIVKRLENMGLHGDVHEPLYRYFNEDNKSLDVAYFRKAIQEDRYKDLANFISAQALHEVNGVHISFKEIQDNIMQKNYQLDTKDGTLHGVSHERQYVKGQALDDLKDNFYDHSTELDQKKKYFDAYFKELSKSGAYNNKDEIKIMDIGVESGDLTKSIAESALKYFPDKKITLCAVEFTKGFLDKTSDKVNSIENDKLNYVPVIHLVGKRGGYQANQAIKEQGGFDIILGTDLNNFDTKQLLGEIKEYSTKDTVLLLKHSNEKDFLQVIKDSVDQKFIRNFGSKVPEIEGPLNEAGMEFRSGEMKAAFKLGPLKPAAVQELLNIKDADYLNQPFQKKGYEQDLAKQRILEFAIGAPIAAFPQNSEVREQAIKGLNDAMEKEGGVAYNNSTCHVIPVSKEIAPAIKEANYNAVEAALKSVELAQEKHTDRNTGWGDRFK